MSLTGNVPIHKNITVWSTWKLRKEIKLGSWKTLGMDLFQDYKETSGKGLGKEKISWEKWFQRKDMQF